jgi:amidase
MEATVSNPSVEAQFGQIVGIPDAGQVNALATINIRGERSVTCQVVMLIPHPEQCPYPTRGLGNISQTFCEKSHSVETHCSLV